MANSPDSAVEPPNGVPQTITQGMERQNHHTVVDIVVYTEQLIDQLTTPPEELEDDGEEVVSSAEVEDRENWTKVVKRVPCGKNCNGCPHGPYLYLVRRVSVDRLEWIYVGKAEAKAEEMEVEFPDSDDEDFEAHERDDDDNEEDSPAAAPDEDITEATYPDQDDDEDDEAGGEEDGE